MAKDSEFAKSLRSPFQWAVVTLILCALGAVVLGPIASPDPVIHHNPILQNAHQIGIAMFSYATDHNGTYPTGKSSTEVFQKLIDEGYITDPTIFWEQSFKVPGKIKSTSKLLRPENVCWDVTVPVDANSPDDLPLVFLTGYRINYISSGSAKPLFSWTKDWTGLAVFYHGNNTAYTKSDGQSDGIITNFISPNFDPKGQKYQQLTPAGPLGP